MRNINSVRLLGRLGRDVEVTYVGNGTALAKFSLATTYAYKKGEEWIEETEWHDVTAWARTAEALAGAAKGERILVEEGRIKTEKWEKDGEEKSKKVVVANIVIRLDSVKGEYNSAGSDDEEEAEEEAPAPKAAPAKAAPKQTTKSAAKATAKKSAPPADDDLPF